MVVVVPIQTAVCRLRRRLSNLWGRFRWPFPGGLCWLGPPYAEREREGERERGRERGRREREREEGEKESRLQQQTPATFHLHHFSSLSLGLLRPCPRVSRCVLRRK